MKDIGKYFIIVSNKNKKTLNFFSKLTNKKIKNNLSGFNYDSFNNSDFLTVQNIKKLINKNITDD